jgi:iron complex outermembrane receptor protein
MSQQVKLALFASVAAMTWAGSSVTMAQSDQPAAAVTDNNFEEIVVTARRREERVQTVPIAISAFSQDTLNKNNITSVQDLQNLVPSLTAASSARDSVALSIRGQGGFAPGGSPSVTSYMNEVPTPIFGLGSYFDLQSVEVLKGPQGTLFGQNSVGGAITLVSKRPTNDFGGNIEATFGNYNDKEIEGMLNIPIIKDKLLIRVAGEGQLRDGYTTLLGTVAHPNERIDLDNREFTSFRGRVTFRPTDDIENDFIADYYLSNTNGSSYILSAVDPKGLAVAFLGKAVLQALAEQMALGPRTEIESWVDDPVSKTLNQGFTDIFRYDIADDLTFRNILGYRFSEYTARQNTSAAPLPILTFPTRTLYPLLTKQYTEEPQFQGKSFGGKLIWVLGGFFQRNPPQPYYTVHEEIFGAINYYSSTQPAEETEAIYAQGTYDLSDLVEGLKFTGGYRYTWDYRSLSSGTISGNPPHQGCVPAFLKLPCTLAGNGSFHAPTWTVDFDYQLAPDTLAYVASRRGYRSGGFNNFTLDKADQEFGPEFVTDLEIGLKSTVEISGMKARTNVAAYRQWYDAVQLPDTILQNGLPAAVTLNAASAVLNGVEFEGMLVPTKGLELTATYAYGEAGFTSFASPAALAANSTYNWSNLPKHKIIIGADYHLPVDSALGDMSMGFNFLWQDHFFNSTSQDPLQTTPNIMLLNLQAQWQNMFGRPFDLSFFMTNATDRTYVLGGFEVYRPVGTSSILYNEPRMFGFRLRYRFGGEAGGTES